MLFTFINITNDNVIGFNDEINYNDEIKIINVA